MKFALLGCNSRDLEPWVISLKKKPNISYQEINVLQSDWLTKSLETDYELYLLKSPGMINSQKQVFDERAQILSEVLGKSIYPSLTEIRLHENKKYLAEWLRSLDIPCPQTVVLLDKEEAKVYLSHADYPLVAKQNIGSSGKGVRIIPDLRSGLELAERTFTHGLVPKVGPNLRSASLLKKVANAISKKGLLRARLTGYQGILSEPQKYLILQEFIHHSFEWRTVRIGESYFAHKKMVIGEKASGSLTKDYSDPPLELLDFVRNLTNVTGLNSVSIDVFESPRGYLINEIQTFFGQSDPYQMKVQGKIGRYRNLKGTWVFEEGDFASNQCYDLRISHAISLIGQDIHADA